MISIVSILKEQKCSICTSEPVSQNHILFFGVLLIIVYCVIYMLNFYYNCYEYDNIYVYKYNALSVLQYS